MSTCAAKRSLAQAIGDAQAFLSLFAGTYERWEIAGSVRRRKPEVGDIEHVVMPKFEILPSDDLFATPTACNLLLRRCDELFAAGAIARHVYGSNPHGAPSYRWGELNRGCDFRGFNHEIFSATLHNWGSKLAILTGPADFSTTIVTRLHDGGYRNFQGHVWSCDQCPERTVAPVAHKCEKRCPHCQGTGLKPVRLFPVPTEQEFFHLAGMVWVEPEKRQ